MKTGLTELKTLGVPVDSLKPQALAGLATNAAKSVTDTVKWAAGTAAIPGLPNQPSIPGLPGDIQAKFDAAATNGAFAVNLTQGKIEPPVKQEVVVEPASNTVNTATVTAAAARVVGNDKVPSVSDNSGVSEAKTKVLAFVNFIDSIYESSKALLPTITELEQANSITQEQWNQLNGEVQVLRATYNARAIPLQEITIAAINSLPSESKGTIPQAFQKAQSALKLFVSYVTDIVKRIKDLANKIAT